MSGKEKVARGMNDMKELKVNVQRYLKFKFEGWRWRSRRLLSVRCNQFQAQRSTFNANTEAHTPLSQIFAITTFSEENGTRI
jgi:hypothetical protein